MATVPRRRGDEPEYESHLFRAGYPFPAGAGMNRLFVPLDELQETRSPQARG